VERGAVYLAIGGLRDVWGFVDLTSGRPLIVPHEAVFFGPDRALGRSLVVLPVLEGERTSL
jgi:hypothetical protein